MSLRQIVSRSIDENCDKLHPEQARLILSALADAGYEIVKKRKPGGRIRTADVRKRIGEPISVFDAAVAPERKFETR